MFSKIQTPTETAPSFANCEGLLLPHRTEYWVKYFKVGREGRRERENTVIFYFKYVLGRGCGSVLVLHA